MDDQTARYRRHLRLFFYCVVGGVMAGVGFFALKLLFPFALAWMMALLLQPALQKLTKLTGFSRGTVAILLLLVTALVGGGLLFWLFSRLATELPQLAAGLSEGAEQITRRLSGMAEAMRHKLPFLSALPDEKWNALGSELMEKGIGKLSSALTATAGDFLVSLPAGLFATIVFFMSAFYFLADFEEISGYLTSLLPRKAVQKLGGLRRQLFSTTLSYLKAYLLLLAITFGILLIAFFGLRVKFAITLALLTALLDALPVLGVGTVLIPWGLLELLAGDWKRGILLIVLWLAMTLFRQLAEPRIVGAKLGLHPLAALVAVWVGAKLLGLWGLFWAPVGALLLRGGLDAHRETVAREDR